MASPKPLLLMILDGWGHSDSIEDNAIAAANTPNWDRLAAQGAFGLIETSGVAVGLPDGQMGNSEVGHMNIGAGRVVFQDFTRISEAVANDKLKTNPAITEMLANTGAQGGRIHVMGLISPGGVHSHEDHIFALINIAAASGLEVLVHAFLDGRDTPPKSAAASLRNLQTVVDQWANAEIVTLSGRYFAMDRDQRWERVARAYSAIAYGQADHHEITAAAGLEAAYLRDESDEFVTPTIIGSRYEGVTDADSILFANFRADRARELTAAFVQEDFAGFEKPGHPRLTEFLCLTEYQKDLPAKIAFPPLSLRDGLGEILASRGLKQLRIAETEKYAHVTFFFNGGVEAPFDGEQRELIPSPDVATYDLQPQMSAPELTDKLVAAITSLEFDVIICNVANADMVGHTGIFPAAVAAVEAVDRCVGDVAAAIQAVGGEMLITADHGNIEQMVDHQTNQAHTAHTTNLVPLLYLGREATLSEGGALQDIAPTMLDLLNLPQPDAMTGRNLVQLAENEAAA